MSADDLLPAAVFEDAETELDDDPDSGTDVEEQARFWGRRTKKLAEVHLEVEEVQRSLDELTAKLTRVLANQSSTTPKGFQLDSFTVGLALSATGKLFMIAEAGVEASIELTFTRQRA